MSNPKSIYLNKDLINIAKQTSINLDIPVHIVIIAYKSFFDNIKNHIVNYDMSNINNEDDLIDKPTSFNILGIGKMYTNYKIINKTNENRSINEDIKY